MPNLTAEGLQEIQDKIQPVLEEESTDDKTVDDEPTQTPDDDYQEAPEAIKAREDGWVPLEEWKGDPDDWVDAKEFLFRGELMGRIKKQSKAINTFKDEIEGMKEALRTLGEHNKKIAENERKKALQELRSAKKEAFEDRDFDAMEEIDERMAELKSVDLDAVEEKQPKDNAKDDAGVNPEVEAWLENNQWYTKDPILQHVTNGAVQQLLAEDPDLESDPSDLLEKAKKLVMKEMPHKFEQENDEDDDKPRRAPKAAVAEPGKRPASASGRKPKALSKYLSPMQRKVGDTFVKSGAIDSLEDYAKQLDDLGELNY